MTITHRLSLEDRRRRALAAMVELKQLAERITPSEFPGLARKIRSALKSAEGSVRNADNHEARAGRPC